MGPGVHLWESQEGQACTGEGSRGGSPPGPGPQAQRREQTGIPAAVVCVTTTPQWSGEKLRASRHPKVDLRGLLPLQDSVSVSMSCRKAQKAGGPRHRGAS